MKKIIILAFSVLYLSSAWIFYSSPLIKNIENGETYLYKNSSECVISKNSDLASVFFKTGEAYVLPEGTDYNKVIKDFSAKIIAKEQTEFGISYYCYSESVKYRKEMFGKVVNLHIFVGKSQTKIGFPLIYGGY